MSKVPLREEAVVAEACGMVAAAEAVTGLVHKVPHCPTLVPVSVVSTTAAAHQQAALARLGMPWVQSQSRLGCRAG